MQNHLRCWSRDNLGPRDRRTLLRRNWGSRGTRLVKFNLIHIPAFHEDVSSRSSNVFLVSRVSPLLIGRGGKPWERLVPRRISSFDMVVRMWYCGTVSRPSHQLLRPCFPALSRECVGA